MKKLILFAAILFAGVSVVKADEPKATVDLKVRLAPIHTIAIGDLTGSVLSDAVLLDYTNATDYKNGVNNKQSNHLVVTSTGAFTVNVKAMEFTGGTSGKVMPLSTINLIATNGTDNSDVAKMEKVNLSIGDKSIITSAIGGFNKKFNVEYKGNGENDYMKDYYKTTVGTENDNIFTTTLTYTLVPN